MKWKELYNTGRRSPDDVEEFEIDCIAEPNQPAGLNHKFVTQYWAKYLCACVHACVCGSVSEKLKALCDSIETAEKLSFVMRMCNQLLT